MRVALRMLFLVAPALLAACAQAPARPPVTEREIVEMSRQGYNVGTILAVLKRTDSVYQVSGSELASLKAEGVADPVLDYMLDTYLRSERERDIQACMPAAEDTD